jgi:hypothetical protein
MSNFKLQPHNDFYLYVDNVNSIANNIKNENYTIINFQDVSAPTNGVDGTSKLYKKIGSDGLFWKPDSAGSEFNLASVGGGLSLTGGIMSGNLNMDNNQILNVSVSGGIGLIVNNNTLKVSADASVTSHSDVNSAGSGDIITTLERNAISSISSYSITSIGIGDSPYDLLLTDDVVFIDTTTGKITINLNLISTLTDNKKKYTLVDSGGNGSINNVTINKHTTDTVMGDTSILIDNNYNSLTLISDSVSNWLLI